MLRVRGCLRMCPGVALELRARAVTWSMFTKASGAACASSSAAQLLTVGHVVSGDAKTSAAGNRTRVFRVTGGNTDHYTTAELRCQAACAALGRISCVPIPRAQPAALQRLTLNLN